MAVTFGFYNAKEGDRAYDAIQMSSIFDGIILDGIFQNIGTSMMVTAVSGMMVNVGIGRAWFDHTWTLNDAPLPLTIDLSEVILHRIDIIALDVDSREDIRANSIIIIKGTPSSNPKPPTLIKDNDHKQYPLAHIRVNAGVTSITQSAITNKVGSTDTPFIVCPLEHVSIDELMSQWVTEWNEFYSAKTTEMEEEAATWHQAWESFYQTYTTDMENTANYWRTTWTNTYNTYKAQFDAFYDGWVDKMDTSYSEWEGEWDTWYADFTTTNTAVMNTWRNEEQAAFDAWFAEIQTALSEDVAGNLEVQIQELQDKTDKLEETVMDYQYGPDGTLSVARFIFDSSYDPSTPDIDTNDVIMDNQNRPIKSTTRYILETPTISKNKKLIERGICLGNAITEAQADAINKGTFENIYLGDYWELPKSGGGYVRYMVVDFNYGITPTSPLLTAEAYPNLEIMTMVTVEEALRFSTADTSANTTRVHRFNDSWIKPQAVSEAFSLLTENVDENTTISSKINLANTSTSSSPYGVATSTTLSTWSTFYSKCLVPDIGMLHPSYLPMRQWNTYSDFESGVNARSPILSYFSLAGIKKMYRTNAKIPFSGINDVRKIGIINYASLTSYPAVRSEGTSFVEDSNGNYYATPSRSFDIILLFKIQGTTKRILPNI